MADPWLKFYPSDWRADPALRICGLAARGLWIEMLGIMHEAKQRGVLIVNGSPPTDAQLAVLVGTTTDQLSELIGELDAAGVFSRTGKGVIYSRRMTNDEKKARVARKNGKSGGNPTLRKQKEKPPSDNLPVKLRSQKPDTRKEKNIAEEIFDEQFWPAFPHPAGDPKKPAKAKFVAAVMGGVPPDDIIAGIAPHKAALAKETWRKPCQAQVWINQERWDSTTPTNGENKPATAEQIKANKLWHIRNDIQSDRVSITPADVREYLGEGLINEKEARPWL